MIDQELRHKKNVAFISELPIALNSLKQQFFEFIAKGLADLTRFIFVSIQMLVCRRFGMDNEDEDNIITPADFKFERDKKEDYMLFTYEIDNDFVKKSCDSKFFTIYLNIKTSEIRVFALEYEPAESLGEGFECYMLCENRANGLHNNFGTVEDDKYETYINKIKTVLTPKSSEDSDEMIEKLFS